MTYLEILSYMYLASEVVFHLTQLIHGFDGVLCSSLLHDCFAREAHEDVMLALVFYSVLASGLTGGIDISLESLDCLVIGIYSNLISKTWNTEIQVALLLPTCRANFTLP